MYLNDAYSTKSNLNFLNEVENYIEECEKLIYFDSCLGLSSFFFLIYLESYITIVKE